MSKKEHVSATPATMWLKQHKVPFEDGIYEYVEHGGTAQAYRYGNSHRYYNHCRKYNLIMFYDIIADGMYFLFPHI